MIDVLNLALPFFGLIFIGFACGKLKQIPDTALAWMNFFILYVALPALFYRILAQTPLEKLAQIDFIFATTLGTFWAFALSFAIGMAIRHGNIAEAAIAGLAGGYGNIGDARAGGGGAGGSDLLLRQQYPVYHGAVSDGACQAATGEHRHDHARRG